jgi:TRAP-type C4-dicarboxylate transport system substrate-binding protein
VKDVKRLRFLAILVVVVLIGAAVWACAPTPTPIPTPNPIPTPTPTFPEIKLTFATWLPIGHPNAVIGYEYWANLVTERTNGAVTFEWYPLQQLIKGPEMLAGVGAGVADLGVVVHSYEAGRVPLHTAESLPFAFETEEQVVEVYNQAEAILQDELAPFNVRSLYYTPAQFHVLFTMDKPIRAVEDLEGLRLRSAGGVEDEIMEVAGASPVTMDSAEVYTAMQRGMLDGVASLPTSPEAHDWSEFIKYMIMTNHTMISGSTIINLDTWNSLPPEVQEIMVDAGRDMQQHALGELDGMTQEAIDDSKGYGMEVIVMSESERTKWKELCAPIWDEWLADRQAEGKGDAAEQLLQIIEEVTK